MEYELQHISLAQPPPAGRAPALRIGDGFPYVMAEARKMTDQFEAGMPSTGDIQERGIASEGVIAYRVQTRKPTAGSREGNKLPLYLLTLAALQPGQAAPLDNGATLTWFASDFAIENRLWIRQHRLGLLAREGGSDHDRVRAWDRPAGSACQAVLDAVAEVRDLAAAGPPGDHDHRGRRPRRGRPLHDHGLRTVAKDGALAALAESKPGGQQAKRDVELVAARAEAARLGEAVKELAVKLMLIEGKGRWG